VTDEHKTGMTESVIATETVQQVSPNYAPDKNARFISATPGHM